MRLVAASLALLILSAPAAAQAPAAAPTNSADEIARRLADPATADRLAAVMQSLAKSLLALPAGEVAAAVEGRKPSPSDRRLTVRDLGRRDDPYFDKRVAEQMARTRPMVQQSLKALGQAIPTVMGSLRQAGEALDRAAANMPDPTYPKR